MYVKPLLFTSVLWGGTFLSFFFYMRILKYVWEIRIQMFLELQHWPSFVITSSSSNQVFCPLKRCMCSLFSCGFMKTFCKLKILPFGYFLISTWLFITYKNKECYSFLRRNRKYCQSFLMLKIFFWVLNLLLNFPVLKTIIFYALCS